MSTFITQFIMPMFIFMKFDYNDFDFDLITKIFIFILNQFQEYDFDMKSISICVILILIWNHFQNDLSQHWLEDINQAIENLQVWMSSNHLRLSPTKTRFIWFATRQQLDKIDLKPLAIKYPGPNILVLCPWPGSNLRPGAYICP